MQSVFRSPVVIMTVVLRSLPSAGAVTVHRPQYGDALPHRPQYGDAELQIPPSGSISVSDDLKLISRHSASAGSQVQNPLVRREPEQQQQQLGDHSFNRAGLHVGADGLAVMPRHPGEEAAALAAKELEALGVVPPVPGATAMPVVPPPPAVPAIIPNGTMPGLSNATTPELPPPTAPKLPSPAAVAPAATTTAVPTLAAAAAPKLMPPVVKESTPAPSPLSGPPTPPNATQPPLVGGPPTSKPLLPLPPVAPLSGEKGATTKVSGSVAPLPPLVQKKTPAVTVLLFGVSVTIGLVTAAALACLMASHNEASKHRAATGVSAVGVVAAAVTRDQKAAAAEVASRRVRASAGSGESPAPEGRSFASKDNRW